MRPLRLVLDGFGSYRRVTEIDFSGAEFFALVGPTGSGKSTVVDALCFALYGTVPRWDNEKEVRNALAPSANACTVQLVFELGGQRYVAARSLSRDKRGQVTTKAARLERLDASVPAEAPLGEILQASVEQLADRPDLVKAQVQQLLGLSYEHFTQSVLLPQGGFSEFLRATPANRQRLLVELLAFGVYKEVGQRARERAQRAEAERDAARQAAEQLTDATAGAEQAAADRLDDLAGLADAVEAGLTGLTGLQQRADEAARLAGQASAEAAQLGALRMPPGVPDLAHRIADADALLAAARTGRDAADEAAEAAGQARAALPDKTRTERLLGAHADQRQLAAEADGQAAALVGCREAEESQAARLQAAERTTARAQQALEEAGRAHAAAGLAESLHAGDDCPVCRQPVLTLPPRTAPADLAAARSAADAAVTAQRQEQRAHAEAEKAGAAAASTLDGTRARLAVAERSLAGAAPEPDLRAQLEAITAADDAVTRTRREATARHAELAAAERSRAALAAGERDAWAALHAARDTLVGLGAPAVGRPGGAGPAGSVPGSGAAGPGGPAGLAGPAAANDLATAWAGLTGWAGAEAEKRARKQPDLDKAAALLRQEAGTLAAELAGLLAGHGLTDIDPLTRAPAAVAAARARAEAALLRIRADRKRAAELDRRIAAWREEAQVAGMLGNLLRANAFEAWLCSEALDSLVLEASATLKELSGGQYELGRGEHNDLVVVDYADAGAERLVRTLSGGETFQASLALALALSRQVISLSAGMRELNSMFLDEGFGTLDPDTLETVASTLERLASDSDRMVGVITHVTELAERVPVRFVVSRTGTTSAVRREGLS